MGVRLWAAAAEAQWDRLLDGAPGATPFHRWWFLQMQADLHGWQLERFVVCEDGRPVGVVPLLLVCRGPARVSAPVPFPYLGPVVPQRLLGPVLLAVGHWCRWHRVLVHRFDLAPTTPDSAASLRQLGLSWEAATTRVVDLSAGTEEQFWRGTHRSLRKSVRKAERRGGVVTQATAQEVQDWLPQLLSESYGARGSLSPYPADVGRRLVEAAAGRPDVRLISARIGDRPGGLLVGLQHGRTAYSWIGGGFRARREDSPNALLHLGMARWALASGCTRWDLVGAVDPGVARFKETFGARAEHYTGGAVQVPWPPLRPAERAVRAALRHGWRSLISSV